jgi:hypothetical protein
MKMMDKDALKKKLHEQIDAIDDELSLQMLHEAAVEYGKAEDKSMQEDELTPDQVKRLEESIRQLDSGQWKSHEEVMKLSRTWLQK